MNVLILQCVCFFYSVPTHFTVEKNALIFNFNIFSGRKLNLVGSFGSFLTFENPSTFQSNWAKK